MILHCSYEELRALTSGAELTLSDSGPGSACAVAAPAEVAAEIDVLLPRLTGDLSISTLAEQRRTREAVMLIRDTLHARLESEVVEYHPGHEAAVLLYFDYAYVLKVLDRLERMGDTMNSMLQVVTGERITPEAAGSFTFPD
jgi:hypothetical protein